MKPSASPPSFRAYCRSLFTRDRLPRGPALPLPEEAHVAVWREYARAAGNNPLALLQAKLPQLNAPIRAGVSATPEYGALTRQGKAFRRSDFGGRLRLERPAALRLSIHDHPAGALPVLITAHRPDLVTLLRAFGHRNEPAPIPPTVNAMMVSGYINWDRIGRYRSEWLAAGHRAEDWPAEMSRVDREETWRFRDRLMLAGTAPYAGLSVRALGLRLTPAVWRRRSLILRIEHEFTHYATKRLFGAMRNNLLDELIADFMGMTAALGRFRAKWFLAGMGIEKWPEIKAEGRAHAYRMGLGDADFVKACGLATRAATGLETVSRRHYRAADRRRFFLGMTGLALADWASPRAEPLFLRAARERAG